MRDRIAAWYAGGRWTSAQVQAAVGKWITQEQADAILTMPLEQPGGDG